MEDSLTDEEKEYVNMSEHTPCTGSLDKEGQQKVIEAIAKAEITPQVVEEQPTYRIVSGTEQCPFCATDVQYKVPENTHTMMCQNCGKVFPLCSNCSKTDENECENCIYCDVANFYNYLSGIVCLEKFLGSLVPPLTDLTTATKQNSTKFTYDDFLNDVGGDDVTWDVKYWEIYGRCVNAGLNVYSKEEDVINFVKEIIAKNRE